MKTELKTLADTRKAAREIARGLTGKELILLYGGLATGKTTFMKFLAGVLGFSEETVSSPTFTIINHYPGKTGSFGIYHVDLYRLVDDANLEPLGLMSILDSGDLVAVEWPEAGAAIFGNSLRPKIELRFELANGRRFLTVQRTPLTASSI